MSEITKRALAASLKNMMLKKPFNKITINDIVEDCGVSRATFYYHFQDIYALVEWTVQDEAGKILTRQPDYDTWQHGLIDLLNAIEENKTLILNVYKHVSQEQVLQYLHGVVYKLLSDIVEECAKGMTVGKEDKEFIKNFYKNAFVGMIFDWIGEDMKTSPDQIVSTLSRMIDGDIPRMLNKVRTDRLREAE